MQSRTIIADLVSAGGPSATVVDDQARVLLELQLRMLEQLAEIGLGVARTLERQAVAAAQEAEDRLAGRCLMMTTGAKLFQVDFGLSFSRVARAVRMTIALQSRLMRELSAPQQAAADRLARGAEAEQDLALEQDRDDPAEAGADEGAGAEADGAETRREDEDLAGALRREASEPLYDAAVSGDWLNQPIADLVAAICQDLGLAPDWACSAEQAWAKGEIDHGEGEDSQSVTLAASVIAHHQTPSPPLWLTPMPAPPRAAAFAGAPHAGAP